MLPGQELPVDQRGGGRRRGVLKPYRAEDTVPDLPCEDTGHEKVIARLLVLAAQEAIRMLLKAMAPSPFRRPQPLA